MVGLLLKDGARRMGEWEFKEGAGSAEALGLSEGTAVICAVGSNVGAAVGTEDIWESSSIEFGLGVSSVDGRLSDVVVGGIVWPAIDGLLVLVLIRGADVGDE